MGNSRQEAVAVLARAVVKLHRHHRFHHGTASPGGHTRTGIPHIVATDFSGLDADVRADLLDAAQRLFEEDARRQRVTTEGFNTALAALSGPGSAKPWTPAELWGYGVLDEFPRA